MLFGLFNKNDKDVNAAHPLNHPVAVEIKYGDGAISGDAGIKKHLDDFNSFIESGAAIARTVVKCISVCSINIYRNIN